GLQLLTRALAPGGVFVIAVPDADGVQARLFGPHWFHLDVPRHLFHFGRGSLTRMLERAGLRVERHWHQEFEYDVMGVAQSALNVLMPTPNVFFDRLTGKPSEGSSTERTASFVLGSALSALAVPPVTLTTLLERGGTLIVSARPPAP
ncbi:MAG: methyltransferase domain-containing protein, partial [Cystobacter sp.]